MPYKSSIVTAVAWLLVGLGVAAFPFYALWVAGGRAADILEQRRKR